MRIRFRPCKAEAKTLFPYGRGSLTKVNICTRPAGHAGLHSNSNYHTRWGECPECHGTGGYVTDWDGMESYGEVCAFCNGTGRALDAATKEVP